VFTERQADSLVFQKTNYLALPTGLTNILGCGPTTTARYFFPRRVPDYLFPARPLGLISGHPLEFHLGGHGLIDPKR
jgi:hypothetical protein